MLRFSKINFCGGEDFEPPRRQEKKEDCREYSQAPFLISFPPFLATWRLGGSKSSEKQIMKYRNPIHLVAARRSPIGRFGGAFKEIGAVDLAVQVGASTRSDMGDDAPIDSAIFGNVLQAGLGMNVARQIALRLDLPQSTPAFTVNMVCGSGLKAVALGAAEIDGGESRVVLAGGTENMSRAPYLAEGARWGNKLGDAVLRDTIQCDGLRDPLHGVSMGETTERIAEKYGIDRDAQDKFALRSQTRALESAEHFAREIVSIQAGKETVSRDEHPRADTTLEKLARLRPAFRENGSVTAGNASGLNDGAAALLLCDARVLAERGWKSRARVVGARVVGCDPLMMGLGPISAIRALCDDLDWDLKDVGAVEINEAFAAQTLACARELQVRDEQLNRRGGAIALGHPIGASGARVLVTLLHILEDDDLQRGIASLCVGGGMGIALAIERD